MWLQSFGSFFDWMNNILISSILSSLNFLLKSNNLNPLVSTDLNAIKDIHSIHTYISSLATWAAQYNEAHPWGRQIRRMSELLVWIFFIVNFSMILPLKIGTFNLA